MESATTMTRDTNVRTMKFSKCMEEVHEILYNIQENTFLLDYKVYIFRKGCILKTTGYNTDTPYIDKLSRLFWFHKSKSDRCYILGEIPSGYMYISMDLESMDFMETTLKIYVSDSYAELVEKAMSKKAYKKYMKHTHPICDECAS